MRQLRHHFWISVSRAADTLRSCVFQPHLCLPLLVHTSHQTSVALSQGSLPHWRCELQEIRNQPFPLSPSGICTVPGFQCKSPYSHPCLPTTSSSHSSHRDLSRTWSLVHFKVLISRGGTWCPTSLQWLPNGFVFLLAGGFVVFNLFVFFVCIIMNSQTYKTYSIWVNQLQSQFFDSQITLYQKELPQTSSWEIFMMKSCFCLVGWLLLTESLFMGTTRLLPPYFRPQLGISPFSAKP